MHMADALLTPAVAGVMYAASAVVAGASIVELHKEEKQDLTSAAKKLPTMAVMSALVFAGQMINYTIPGTGSSGHLCGGLLLTSVLGPWAGFLSMIVILTIQCLFFADGGLLALGANVWNMAFLRLLRRIFSHLPAADAQPLLCAARRAGGEPPQDHACVRARLRADAAARRVLGRAGDDALRHHGSAVRRVLRHHAADPSGHRPDRGPHHGGGAAVPL